jgi:hypothetical protein
MKVERATADFFTLLMGKLTNWNFPRGGEGPGDPIYLNAEQTAELAAAGIRMLSSLLPQEAAQKIDGTSGPPGCCVMINGRLVCVRAETAAHA